jgi:hypothetical protein
MIGKLGAGCHCVTTEETMAVRREGNFWYFVIDLPRG